jgi:predicted RNA-binding Zn ribbon-like protein
MDMTSVSPEVLFVDFVNSEWYDGRGNLEDRLFDQQWRSEFLQYWKLGDPGTPSASTLRRLLELRHTLRFIVEEIRAGLSPSTTRLSSIAPHLPPVSMRLDVVGRPPTAFWTSARPSWTFVRAEIIRSCLAFMAGPARNRLGRCDNEGCRWAFVDTSRNRSRRWCDPVICGNVSKVRAYRERHRLQDANAPKSV